MSGRMEWTDAGDYDDLPGRATDSVAAVLDRLDPCRALAGKEDEDELLPPGGDLDEDDEFDEDDDALDDLDAEDDDDELVDDDEDLDDELIDLDDEYDDTDVDDRPHPGHRYDE
jgi:hypothetical protein